MDQVSENYLLSQYASEHPIETADPMSLREIQPKFEYFIKQKLKQTDVCSLRRWAESLLLPLFPLKTFQNPTTANFPANFLQMCLVISNKSDVNLRTSLADLQGKVLLLYFQVSN